MTDFDSDPLDPLDELASAALDGIDPPGDADAPLDADTAQELADRVARLARTRDQLAAPVTLPSDDVRDQMIARAISVAGASADAGASSTDDSAVTAPVTSLDAHRSRRTARLRRFAPIAAAAAVLLLVAIVTPALLDSGSEDLASTATEAASDAEGAGADMADTAAEEPTNSLSDQALAPDDGDTADAMEEEMAGVEASGDTESGAVLVVPSPAEATESADGLNFDELARQVSDEELLDALIRYRAGQSANSLRSEAEDDACGGVVDHPIDLVVAGSYRSQPAVFFAQIDGSAVLAVTVVDPACEVLAAVTSD
jgi:hypothetical protein